MNRETVVEILQYNTWANGRILAAVSRVDPDQFTRDLGGSHASVQGTMVHMLWGEWLWLERWRGHSPKELFAAEKFPSPAAVAVRWQQVQAGQQAFMNSLVPNDLQRVVSYTNRAGEVWEYALWRMMVHVVNHSAYHRGQVTNMLRLLGAETTATDFLVWWDEEKS